MWPHAAVLRPVALGFATVAAMKIRYNPVLGVTMIVLGVVCEVLGLWLLALGETDPTLFVGVIVVLLGLPYLLRPYFLVHHTTVEVLTLLGPARRRYEYERLELVDNKLFAISGDHRVRVPVVKAMARSSDWGRLAQLAGDQSRP